MKALSHPTSLQRNSQSKEMDQLTLTLKNARLEATILANALGAAAIADLGPRYGATSPGHQSVYLSSHSSILIVIDTGASTSLTPNELDFVTSITSCGIQEINGLNGKSQVKGKGTVAWTVKDV